MPPIGRRRHGNQVSGHLPIAAAWDVRLNIDSTLTVLMDGYGVFETPAPHRAQPPAS